MCGYCTGARQKGKKQHEESHETTAAQSSKKDWERRAPYDFTGCLAHVDITSVQADSGSRSITRIIGYPVHNAECTEAKIKRFPSIPLHPHVREIALRQLRKGARYSSNKNHY